MELTLAENIRSFRKQRKLTQEKLAEALGVTVGAVYKWESGLSQPELNMLVEIADLFDVSVDVLLGYKVKDNRLDAVVERICESCQRLDPAALTEAEKALGKYPHSFQIVHTCAGAYLAFGAGSHDPAQLRRALELLEQSLVLLPQNTDPHISASTLSGETAAIRFLLDEREKSIELLRENNTGGMFSSDIGACLAIFMGRTEEAVPYLAEGLLTGILTLINTIRGYFFVFRERSNWRSAQDILEWGNALLSGLKTEETPGFLDKTHTHLLVMLAYARKKDGLPDESRDLLCRAANLARDFDSRPDYSLRSVRFTEHLEQSCVFDILDATAAGSATHLIDMLKDPELIEEWKELCGNEE